MKLVRRSLLILLLICLGCAAQSAPSELGQKIETLIREYYKIPSDVKLTVGPLRPSDFPNYDAVTVTMEGQTRKQALEFLVAKDQKTMLRVTKIDMTKNPYDEVMKKIDVGNRPVRGNPNAKVTVVNFDDFECPFCSRLHETLFPDILKEYGDRVKFVYMDFPLTDMHPWAMHAAVDANCLAAQSPEAYWDFADYIHANQRDVNSEKSADAQFAALDRIVVTQGQRHRVDQTKLQACMKAQDENSVKASIKEGDALDLSATPVLFIAGEELEGAVPASQIRAALDSALARAGVTAPKASASAAPAAESKPAGK